MHLQTRSFGDYLFRPHAVFPSVEAATPRARASSSSPSPPSPATYDGTLPPAPPLPPPAGWDVVVVTTKALPDRVDDGATIAPLVRAGEPGRETAVVLIQNGVGVEAPHRARFPRCPLVSAVTVISAEQVADGVVRQNRWTRITLGPYAGSGDAGLDEELDRRGDAAARFLARWWGPQQQQQPQGAAGGIKDVELMSATDLQTVRWHKLCINAAMNPSAVLAGGLGPADMLADDELARHLRGVMMEIYDAGPRLVAAGKSPTTAAAATKTDADDDSNNNNGNPFVRLGLAHPDAILRSAARNAGARPSMLLDWEAGRPLELEVILGNAVREARAKGVELVRCQTLYALLRSAMRARERAKGKDAKL